MILFILLALSISAIRGYDLRALFRERSLIPLWVCEAIFWIFQICAWCGIYTFVPYGAWLERLLMASLLWPVLKFGLYFPAILGAVMTVLGSILNRMCVTANAGAMPVYPTLSRMTGYFTDGALEASGDAGHMLMTAQTKLNWLGDYIDVGFSVMSPGDVLMHLFVTVVVLAAARALTVRKGSERNA